MAETPILSGECLLMDGTRKYRHELVQSSNPRLVQSSCQFLGAGVLQGRHHVLLYIGDQLFMLPNDLPHISNTRISLRGLFHSIVR